jgi:predicted acyl esterase
MLTSLHGHVELTSGKWHMKRWRSLAPYVTAAVCLISTITISPAAVADELALPPPDRVIEIPMRDGVKLPANVFLPHGTTATKFPCVLVRHPLGKDSLDPAWLSLVKDGYALVIQSTRSCCDESGKTIPYLTDGWSDDRRPADGYDTVQWLASADFCEGSVSTVGSSATGITQFLLAPSSPPNLSCQFIEMAPPSMYQYAIYPGGQFRKEQVEGWLRVHKRDPSVTEWLKGKPRYDAFWSRFNAIDYADLIKVPQLHIGGWYDIFLQGTIDAFCAAQQHSQSETRQKHRLIIGPWGHRWRKSGKLGDFPLTKEQITPPVPITQCNWLDYHVKGVKNDVAEAPPVQYYVMGPFDGSPSTGNTWRTADSWPPSGTEYCRWFLSSEGKIQGNEGDSNPLDIAYDASNPVPTIGGRNLFMPDGPRDLKALKERKDVACFLTDALELDTEVTGRLWANIYLSDVTRERDVCVRLVDIWPTGEHYLIAEGISHVMPARPYESNKDPRLVIVDLWSTSMVFAKGHRIGVLLSASNFPAYDCSFTLEEGKGNAFTFHSSKKYASSLALPIMAHATESE